MRANKNIIDGQPVDLPPSLKDKGYFGKPQPCLTDTHHIVPVKDYANTNRRPEVIAAIQESKQILSDYKIDINSAANGVYLPSRAGLPIPGPVHLPVHTDAYFLLVRNRLVTSQQSDPSPSSIISELINIGKDLVNGTIQP